LYGLHAGGEPLHIMFDPVTGMVSIVNNTFEAKRDLMIVAKTIDMNGADSLLTQVFVEVQPSTVKDYLSVKGIVDKRAADKGVFLQLQILDKNKKPLSENLYWIADAKGRYSGLEKMNQAALQVNAKRTGPGQVELTLTNPPNGPLAFFNRVSLVDGSTRKRILPVFYSDNYISVLPGEKKTIRMEYEPKPGQERLQVSVSGWNVPEQFVAIQ